MMPSFSQDGWDAEALCNNCGLVFKAFDPLHATNARLPRKANTNREKPPSAHHAIYAHLPAAISLIDENAKGGGKASYSQPSRGHCETISKFGMRLSLVGTRFTEAELSQSGRLLFVRVDLPEGPIEAVVSIVSSERGGEDTKKKMDARREDPADVRR